MKYEGEVVKTEIVGLEADVTIGLSKDDHPVGSVTIRVALRSAKEWSLGQAVTVSVERK